MNKTVPTVNTAALYFTERLRKSLEAIAASPLTLVEAPMGYGKTVAVREYLRGRGTRTIWISVPGAGGRRFLAGFLPGRGPRRIARA